jgi:hypothetical protein
MKNKHEHSILFRTDEIHALINGTKMQKRIICNYAYDQINKPADCIYKANKNGWIAWWLPQSPYKSDTDESKTKQLYDYGFNCPLGNVGDILWVREKWQTGKSLDALNSKSIVQKCLDAGYSKPWAPLKYYDDNTRNADTVKDFDGWGRIRPAITMPRWVARLFLKITDIRIDRLQNITEEDCIAEGMQSTIPTILEPGYIDLKPVWMVDINRRKEFWNSARFAFKDTWNRTNNKYNWDSNPWVWVLKFKIDYPSNG